MLTPQNQIIEIRKQFVSRFHAIVENTKKEYLK